MAPILVVHPVPKLRKFDLVVEQSARPLVEKPFHEMLAPSSAYHMGALEWSQLRMCCLLLWESATWLLQSYTLRTYTS